MTLSASLKTAWGLVFLGLLNLAVYWPSFYHMPRSDQLVYLANTAGQNDWTALALNQGNRGEFPYDMKDDLLFRPVVNGFLGTERRLFGYNFALWQIMGLLLHLAAVGALLKLLLRINSGPGAFVWTGFFSVLLANAEMVIWNNVNGYLLFIASLLLLFDYALQLTEQPALLRQHHLKIFTLLTVLVLTHELGVIISALFIGYLWRRKIARREILPFGLPAAIYLILSVVTHVTLSTESQAILKSQNLFTAFLNLPVTIGWWLFAGLFPTHLNVEIRQRTCMSPNLIDWLGNPTYHWPPVINELVFLAGVGLLLLIVLGIRQAPSKKYRDFLLLITATLLAFAFLVNAGRVSQRGTIIILSDNSYYNYFFWALFIPLIYLWVSNHFKKAFYGLLVLLILANGYLTYRLTLYRMDLDTPFRIVNKNIQELIKEEPAGFSFGLEPAMGKEYFTVDWVKNADGTTAPQNLFKLLYPKHYKKTDPDYLVTYQSNRVQIFEKIGTP